MDKVRPMTPKCKEVYDEMFKHYDPSKGMTIPLLNFLFQKIDVVHFDKYFYKFFKKNGTEFSIGFNGHENCAAHAIGDRQHKRYRIEFSTPVFKTAQEHFHRNLGNGYYEIANGRACFDIVQAYMRVMEHEMIHLWFYSQNQFRVNHGPLFRNKVKALFEHTRYTHSLTTPVDILRHKNIRVGSMVKFPRNSRMLKGRIHKIGKKYAHVYAENSNYKVPFKELKN